MGAPTWIDSQRVLRFVVTSRRKFVATRLPIFPIVPAEGLAVVTNEPLPRPLLVTPALLVCTSKLKLQIDSRSTGVFLPGSLQLCANGWASLSITLAIASNRGTSVLRSAL